MIGALATEFDGQLSYLKIELVDELDARVDGRRNGSGIARRSSSSRPACRTDPRPGTGARRSSASVDAAPIQRLNHLLGTYS
jgi:hypothetical protein